MIKECFIATNLQIGKERGEGDETLVLFSQWKELLLTRLGLWDDDVVDDDGIFGQCG
jgi:hypothetical protein